MSQSTIDPSLPLTNSDIKNYIKNTNFSNSDTSNHTSYNHNLSSTITTATTSNATSTLESSKSHIMKQDHDLTIDDDQSFNFRSPKNQSAANLGDKENSPTKELINSLQEFHISEKENRSSEYQNKLNYMPNVNFNEKITNVITNANSTNNIATTSNPFQLQKVDDTQPNTSSNLRYKSPILKEKKKSDLNQLITPPVKTSTVKSEIPLAKDKDLNNTNTPDWMPKELNEKWVVEDLNTVDLNISQKPNVNQNNGSYKIGQKHDNNNGDLNSSMFLNSTIIHNKNVAETPEWKKVAKEHELEQMKEPKFKELFMPFDDSIKSAENSSIDISKNNNLNPNPSSHEASNTTTTTYSSTVSKVLDNHISHSLDTNSLSQQHPLKLFGDQYNTFTKDKLSDLLQNIRASRDGHTSKPEHAFSPVASSVLNASQVYVQEQVSKSKQQNPSSEEDFIKNANDIFRNLQLRGFKVTQSINELTKSPPKIQDFTEFTDDIYSSFTSEFEDGKKFNLNKDISAIEIEQESFNSDTDIELSKNNLERLQQHYESNSSSYTFDQSDFVFPKPADYEEQHSKSTSHMNNANDNINPGSNSGNNNSSSIIKGNHQRHHQTLNNINTNNNKPTLRMEDSTMFEDTDVINAKISELEKKALEAELMNLYNGNFQRLLIENQKLKDELDNQKKLDLSEYHQLQRSLDNQDEDENQVVNDSDLTSFERNVERMNPGTSEEDLQRMQNFISWKRISQLRLQHVNDPEAFKKLNIQNINLSQRPQENYYKGNFLPDNTLPLAYEDMILDLKNNKWISSTLRNKGGNKNTSLDMIDDLITNSRLNSTNEESLLIDESNSDKLNNSILKSSLSKSNLRKKKSLEVSFNLPNDLESNQSNSEATKSNYSNSNNRYNVTNISQLNEVTFSQTRKRLISIITECIASKNKFKNIDWDSIQDIDLSTQQLSSLKDLDKFLPNLKFIDLSNNEIKFLDGLPVKILRVIAENNLIENISSFSIYHDLQFLNLSNNNMVKLSNLGMLIHLTELKIQNNQLVSMEGLNNLTNLIKLDLSHNRIMGEIDFRKFNFKNLQEINLSENTIQSIMGLDCLPNVRVLNLNENQLINLSYGDNNITHSNMKKVLLKFNNLKRINLSKFPALRVVRFDGNQLNTIEGLRSLSKLEEISAKSQNLKIIEEIVKCRDVNKLDLSGNSKLNFKLSFGSKSFLNLNELILSAMDLHELPDNFSELFPNLRELNLNFNKLKDLSSLSGLKNLNRLYAISNNLSKTQGIITSLNGSNKTLKLVDFRLNPVNSGFYPYVFNPSENEKSSNNNNGMNNKLMDQFNDSENYPIQLDTLDDIESFSIHYQSLNKAKGQKEWSERDLQFIENLKMKNSDILNKRLNYETIIINFLPKLKLFDGNLISTRNKKMLRENLLKKKY